jgi:hypothetical protein
MAFETTKRDVVNMHMHNRKSDVDEEKADG